MKLPSKNYEIGDQVKYIGRIPYGFIMPGDILTVIDNDSWIFPPEIYITVATKNGKKAIAYSWKFEKHTE